MCRRLVTTPALAVTNTVTALLQMVTSLPHTLWTVLWTQQIRKMKCWYHDINVLAYCVRNFILKWLSLKEIFSCFGFNVQNFTTFYGPQFYHFLFSAIYFTTLFHSKEKGPRCTALQKNRTRIIHFVLSCKIDIRNKLQIPDADDGRGDGHRQ